MNLIKYCKNEHRIDIAKTIRIGTFYDYRNHEKDEIEDKHEGISDGLHIAPNETIHPNTSEQIEQFNSVQKIFNIKYTDPNIIPNVSIKDLKFIQQTTLPNCYLFSTSEPPANVDLMKKLDYDNYYEITDTKKFCNLLNKSLGKKLQDMGFGENCRINADWAKVEYSDSENMPDPLKFRHSDLAKKKNNFSSENEYRLIFIIFRKMNNKIMPVENKPIDLEVTDELVNCCTCD